MADAPGKYSAGTIFLQVVPVFRDTMDAIRRETKDLSQAIGKDLEDAGRDGGKRAGKAMGEELTKEAEKSGEAASKKYAGAFEENLKRSIKSAQKELNSLSFKDNAIQLEDDFKRIHGKLQKLAKINLDVDFDEKAMLADIALIQGSIEALTKKDHDLRFDVNLAKLGSDLAKVEKLAEAAVKRKRELQFGVELDTKPAERRLGAFEKTVKARLKKASEGLGDGVNQQLQVIRAKMDALGDLRIGIDISSREVLSEISRLQTELDTLASSDAEIDVRIDAGVATAELAAVGAAAQALDGKDVDIRVDVDSGAAVAKMTILGALLTAFKPRANAAGSASENTANSFRSFSFVVLGLVTLLPALIPILGAVGGGLLALIPIIGAVVAGIGILAVGFSGIGGAVSELGKVADERKVADEQIAQGAQRVEGALRAVADAERALADARRNAARAYSDAQRSLQDAIRNGARAEKDAARAVAEARRNAAEAIEDAYEREEDAARSLADAKDRVREAEEDLAEARQKARDEAASFADKQRKLALEERQGVQDLMAAQAEYNAVMADGSSTNVDKEQASINLESAQISLNDTRQEQSDLTAEAAEFARTGVDGTEDVQDAQDALTEALEAQKEAQEGVAEAAANTREVQLEATRAVRDALRAQKRVAIDSARAIADAQRNLARTAADNAQAIADAERNLARARQDRNKAVTETADAATAAEDRLRLAMEKLSPAGRKFAEFIYGLRDEAKAYRDAVQEALLPGVQAAMDRIIRVYGQKFTDFSARMAKVLGDMFRDAAKGLEGPTWKRFFKVMGKLLPDLLDKFGKTTGNWLTIFADVMIAVAPWARKLADAMLKISENVRKYFDSQKGKDKIREFMEFAERVGPQVMAFVGALVSAFFAISEALGGIGGDILNALTGLLNYIADMDPKTLEVIAVTIITIILAFQLAAGAVSIFAIGAAALSTPIGIAITIIVLLAGALYLLWQRSETARKIMTFLWDTFKAYIIPMVKGWVDGAKTIGRWIRDEIIPRIQDFIGWVKKLWNEHVKPILQWIGDKFQWLGQKFKAIWDGYLSPIFQLFSAIVTLLWEGVVKPLLGKIKDKWDEMTGGIDKTWTEKLKPIFDVFIDTIQNQVAPKFEAAMLVIKAAWEALKAVLAEPVRFLIEQVINEGIIGAFNWVARKVGTDEMDTVPVPGWAQKKEESHAQGTASVLPGYTPGRDVHQFYSPTAGRLNLSGGEAIMRPEFSAALGTNGINHLNNLSKRGPAALRDALFGRQQAFAAGGRFWPVPGRRTGTYAGHDGVDINRGSGWDDLNDPIVAAHTGRVDYVGTGRGYGRSIWISGTDGFTTLYGHTNMAFVRAGQVVQGGQLIGRVGNTGNSSAPHLHFGVYPNGTYDSAIGYLGGAKIGAEGGTGPISLPGWVKDILGGPTNWVKDRIASPLDNLIDNFGSNPYTDILTAVPLKLVKAVGSEIKDMAESVGGPIGNVVGAAVDVVSRRDGGILPYNGTMKYDAGGYLPPGLTSVVNLTGKPEPVFTSDQFANMESGGGDGFTYAPTFQGSDLTAADVVDDLDFARRKIMREGKYGRSH
jgi:murein DD-endopeptidase MepM/ murein hydrolase activator NlpD